MHPEQHDPIKQKALDRRERILKWNELENNTNNKIEAYDNNGSYNRASKVRFPKGCVFLAACASGDTDEVRAHLKLGVNINTTNIDGLTALHQV